MDAAPGGEQTVSLLVDARGIGQSGIGRYLSEVLARILLDPRFSRVTLVGPLEPLDRFLASHGAPEHARVIHFPHAFYSPLAQVGWLSLHMRGPLKADVAFFPHYDVPVIPLPMRLVVTVHDLTQFLVRDGFPAWKRILGAALLRTSVSRATRVLADSTSTLCDLTDRFPWVAGKTVVVRLGVSGPPVTNADRRAAIAPFLLCVGNRKPHKNARAAVMALAELETRFPELRLVLAGRIFADSDGVREEACARGVSHAVQELGEVSDEKLHELYSTAACLVFPSLYEGFGLPVLEAMAHGTPVVASNRSSIPEVAGDAALIVDPEEAGALAGAVERILTEDTLRAELAERGRRRAAGFSWDETARSTADVLWATATSLE